MSPFSHQVRETLLLVYYIKRCLSLFMTDELQLQSLLITGLLITSWLTM